jgi:hypothetical protein
MIVSGNPFKKAERIQFLCIFLNKICFNNNNKVQKSENKQNKNVPVLFSHVNSQLF